MNMLEFLNNDTLPLSPENAYQELERQLLGSAQKLLSKEGEIMPLFGMRFTNAEGQHIWHAVPVPEFFSDAESKEMLGQLLPLFIERFKPEAAFLIAESWYLTREMTPEQNIDDVLEGKSLAEHPNVRSAVLLHYEEPKHRRMRCFLIDDNTKQISTTCHFDSNDAPQEVAMTHQRWRFFRATELN
jgi:hypothetical protein